MAGALGVACLGCQGPEVTGEAQDRSVQAVQALRGSACQVTLAQSQPWTPQDLVTASRA